MQIKRWIAISGMLIGVALLGVFSSMPNLAQAARPLTTPSPVAHPNANRIQFQPGSDSAVVQSQMVAGGMDSWILRAGAGQTLSAQLAFATGQGVIIVYGADGNVLLSDHAGATSFSGVLPTTQDYLIDVRGDPNVATSYSLTVIIPPLSVYRPTAKRIQFQPGATSAVVASQIAAAGFDSWVLRAGEGQTLSAQLAFTGGQGVIIVYGADGTVLLSDHAGATSFTGVLPITEDYFIDVRGDPNVATSYTLSVIIPPLPGPQPGPQRIVFQPGATSAIVQGQIAVGSIDTWVLRAQAGQTLSAQLAFTNSYGVLIVYGADGTVLLSDHVGAFSFTGVLPTTQDYYIDVSGNPNFPTSYSLTVNIPPVSNPQPPPSTTRRIQFQPGAISAIVTGQVAAAGTDTWVIRAGAGQTLTAQFSFASGHGVMVVYGADGTVLLSNQAGATSLLAVLPTTQDYYIEMRGDTNVATSYTLTITIPPVSNPQPTVKRIQFQPGAISAIVSSQLAAAGTDSWVIRAGAGQTLNAQLSFTNNVHGLLIIYGADGNVLLSDHAGAASFMGVLPTTQDYHIDVRADPNAITGYTLTVTIPAH